MGRTPIEFHNLPDDVYEALAELGDTLAPVWASFEEAHPEQAKDIMADPLGLQGRNAKKLASIWWMGFVAGWIRKGYRPPSCFYDGCKDNPTPEEAFPLTGRNL